MSELAPTYPLSDFRDQAEEHLDRLRRDGQPEVLTVNGKPALVVQSVDAYQKLLDAQDLAEGIIGVRSGLKSKAEGRGVEATKAFETLRARYGIRRDG